MSDTFMDLHYLNRVYKEVEEVKAAFEKVNVASETLTIPKLTLPGMMSFHKNDGSTVRDVKVKIMLLKDWPMDKPEIFFEEDDFTYFHLGQNRQYKDRVPWSSSLSICDYINCVRHEIFYAQYGKVVLKKRKRDSD